MAEWVIVPTSLTAMAVFGLVRGTYRLPVGYRVGPAPCPPRVPRPAGRGAGGEAAPVVGLSP
jgi:hypothetical protein